jgi:hypothetical protein
VLSHYAYRLVPSVMGGDLYPGRPPPATAMKGVRVCYTKPDRVMFRELDDGSPVFKTQKDLSGRAIVTDSFGKSFQQLTIEPGDGFWGHRDGYNVLYGDWSAKWYGDPQQRFIWWNDDAAIAAFAPYGPEGYNGGNHNCIDCYDNSPSTFPNPPNYSPFTNTYNQGDSTLRWHIFDANEGIDVGVDGQ